MTAATLKEDESSVAIHRHGCLVGSWPKRLWEVSRVLDGKPLWRSRERTGEELRRLRGWLSAAMQGPPEGLVRSLIANAETSRDDSRVVWDFTWIPEKPSNRSGGLGFFTQTTGDNGRPRNPPPLFQDGASIADLGELEYQTSGLFQSRHGIRLVIADAVRLFGESTCRELNLTAGIVRELLFEHFNPRPPLPKRHRPRLIGEREVRALETAEQEAAPAFVRAQRLWWRGLDDHAIAHRLGISTAKLREMRVPRLRRGPCQRCALYFAKQPTPLHLHRCPHYEVTFKFSDGMVLRLALDGAQYLSEIRRVEPKTTGPALPAWNGAWARVSVARWLYRKRGPRTLEDHFGDSMIGMSEKNQSAGLQSFHADYRQLMNPTKPRKDERQTG